MIFRRPTLIAVVLAAFGIVGVQAQNAPKLLQIPSALAARFADMAGAWSISGTAIRQGQKSAEKGSMHCSLVAARTALACTENFAGLFGAPDLKVPYIFGFDKVHKSVWLGEAVPYDGAVAITGTYSENGLNFAADDSGNAGDQAVKVTTSFTGEIGSGKLKEAVIATIGGNPMLTINATFIKQK